MATALRRTRAAHLRQLRQDLTTLRAKMGQPRYRTPKALHRSANACLKASAVGHLLRVEVYQPTPHTWDLRWQVDTYRLWQTMQADGRYLLVTNDFSLGPAQMVALYRRKDGVEKRFRVTKSDLQVSPMYVHLDCRLEGLLLVNMIALLAYSLLERQMRQSGLNLTTRRLIEHLNSLHLVETHYRDGSCSRCLTPLTPAQQKLLATLADALTTLNLGHACQPDRLDPDRQPPLLTQPGLTGPLLA
jgi:hypothetical protein